MIYTYFGWIGAVLGGLFGIIIGGIKGGVIGFALLAWGEHYNKEESWGETLLGILGALLGLFILGGVWYLFNRFPYLGVGIMLLFFLGLVILAGPRELFLGD